MAFVALFVSVQAQGQMANSTGSTETTNGTTVDPGPYAEHVYVDIGADDIIECNATGVGYIYIDGEDDGNGQDTLADEAILASPYIVEAPAFGVYAFPKGGLPELLDMVYFDEMALGLYGSDSGSIVPIPQEKAAILNTDSGPAFVLLGSTWDPDVDIDCTVFTYLDVYDFDATTGAVVKKKAVKRKIAKANKRKVHKKATKRKAAAKRKKAIRKAAEM